MDLLEVTYLSLTVNLYLQLVTALDIQTNAFIIPTLMRNIYHWTFTVIMRAVVFVRIAGTTLKASIVTAASLNSTGLRTSHSMQLTYVNVS